MFWTFLGALSGHPSKEFLDFAADFRTALHLAGISVKAAALWMQMDASQLERELAGVGYLSLARVALMPVEFQRWLAVIRAQRFGLPSPVIAAQQLLAFTEQGA